MPKQLQREWYQYFDRPLFGDVKYQLGKCIHEFALHISTSPSQRESRTWSNTYLLPFYSPPAVLKVVVEPYREFSQDGTIRLFVHHFLGPEQKFPELDDIATRFGFEEVR